MKSVRDSRGVPVLCQAEVSYRTRQKQAVMQWLGINKLSVNRHG